MSSTPPTGTPSHADSNPTPTLESQKLCAPDSMPHAAALASDASSLTHPAKSSMDLDESSTPPESSSTAPSTAAKNPAEEVVGPTPFTPTIEPRQKGWYHIRAIGPDADIPVVIGGYMVKDVMDLGDGKKRAQSEILLSRIMREQDFDTVYIRSLGQGTHTRNKYPQKDGEEMTVDFRVSGTNRWIPAKVYTTLWPGGFKLTDELPNPVLQQGKAYELEDDPIAPERKKILQRAFSPFENPYALLANLPA